MTPLVAFARFKRAATPLAINHQGPFVASTISFNLADRRVLGEAVDEVERIVAEIHMPATIHGGMQGTARTFQASSDNQPLLIVSGLVAVYIVLGMLYESYVHPITILSTLPSAGVGALLALLRLRLGVRRHRADRPVPAHRHRQEERDHDDRLRARRSARRGLSAHDAIVEACLLRFRPIMMTTAAALLGALPLLVEFGAGAEIRRPLGITIVGGLVLSQMLTLYTTPVLYLMFGDLRDRVVGFWGRRVWR